MKKFLKIAFGLALFALTVTVDSMLGTNTSESVQAAGMGGVGLLMLPNMYERGRDFILKMIAERPNLFPTDILQQIADGQKTIDTAHYYFRKEIVTSDAQFIKKTDNQVFGLRNFDKGALDKGVFFAFCDMEIGITQVLSSANKTADNVKYSSLMYDNTTTYAAGTVDLNSDEAGNQFAPVAVSRIDDKLVNTEIQFNAGNDVIIKSEPINKYLVNNLNGIAVSGKNIVPQATPKIIAGEKFLDFQLRFPEGGSFTGSTDFFMELNFYGVELRDKR